MKVKPPPPLAFKPLTEKYWNDFELLFGERGACGGCWCMWWRLSRSEFNAKKGDGNKRAMKLLVTKGNSPGILAYSGKQPVGWCSIGPRDSFPSLERSRVLKRIDDTPVWSIVCFFIAKEYRRSGLSVALIDAAVRFAKQKKARIVEAYPIDPRSGSSPDVFVFTGLRAAFVKAGFVEVARRSETRPIMRREI